MYSMYTVQYNKRVFICTGSCFFTFRLHEYTYTNKHVKQTETDCTVYFQFTQPLQCENKTS